jgi:hypothetical protein
MRRVWLRLAAAVLLVGLLAVPVFAQSGPTPEGFQRRLERWRALPPRERQLILNRWREYQKSPADKKIEMNDRLKKWQSMKTEERTRLREKYRLLRKLPAEERNRLIERYRGHTRPPVFERRFRSPASQPLPAVPHRR